jgi:hypothetical protein
MEKREGMTRALAEFSERLLTICDADTSADPSGWSTENPLWGQCAVVALLAQEIFGGELLRATLGGTIYAAGGSHYINLIEGERIDFTAGQFQQGYPENLHFEERDREYVLSYPATEARYLLLKNRCEASPPLGWN